MSARFTPFAPRPIRFFGLIAERGHRIKSYSVVYGSRPLDRERFEPGLALALKELPPPAPDAGRPGLGFVIQHQGNGGDYVVLCWWDRENELPTLVFVRGGEGWRRARQGESFCVWDLEILWHERCAYVETMLAPGGGSPENYLAASLHPA